MRNRLCTFFRKFINKELVQSGFFISSKFSLCLFLTLKVIASSAQFFFILEKFDIQKIIERLNVSPGFIKKIEDHWLNFDMKFWFLGFASYFSIYYFQNLNFCKFSSKLYIILSLHQLLVLLQYYEKFSTKALNFFFKC